MAANRRGMGIQSRRILLLLIVLMPVLLIAGYISYQRLLESKSEALQANLELARSLTRTFDAFVTDVLHTELAIGLAATASPPPSNESLRKIMRRAEAANPMIRQLNWISPEDFRLVATNPEMEGRGVTRPDVSLPGLAMQEKGRTIRYKVAGRLQTVHRSTVCLSESDSHKGYL